MDCFFDEVIKRRLQYITCYFFAAVKTFLARITWNGIFIVEVLSDLYPASQITSSKIAIDFPDS